MSEKFKLIGFMNLFDIVPDFVMPIFEKDNKYYFEIGDEESLIITEFAPVKESAISEIVFLGDVKSNIVGTKELTLANEPIFAFQSSKEDVFVGTFEEMKEYLKSFKTDSDVLSEIIRDFLGD